MLVGLQVSCDDDDPVSSRVPTTITANSATAVNGSVGAQVLAADRPSVIVLDQAGSPLEGVTVTFAVESGGGSVTGATQTTNEQGVATVGSWTLGPVAGSNTLSASAGTATPVVFTATSINPCASPTPHTLATTSNGQLTTLDCRFANGFSAGTFVDRYTTTAGAAGAFTFTQSSTAFDSFLLLTAPDGTPLAVNDDANAGTTNSFIRALLPAGNYTVAATSFGANETGAYSLTSAAVGTNVTNCDQVWIVRGVTTTQALQTTDCANGGFLSDDLLIFLRGGQSMTVTMTSSVFDTFLELWTSAGRIAFNDDIAPGNQNSQVLFTAGADMFVAIVPTSGTAGATGAYTLTVQ
jgi:hypothetical protein